MPGYQPGEPAANLAWYKAEVGAERMTAEEATAAMFAWARDTGYQVTRASILADLTTPGQEQTLQSLPPRAPPGPEPAR